MYSATMKNDTLEEDIIAALSSKQPSLEDDSKHKDGGDFDDDMVAKVTHVAARCSIQV